MEALHDVYLALSQGTETVRLADNFASVQRYIQRYRDRYTDFWRDYLKVANASLDLSGWRHQDAVPTALSEVKNVSVAARCQCVLIAGELRGDEERHRALCWPQ